MIQNQYEYIPKIHHRNEKSLEYHIVSHDGTMIAFGGNDGYIILMHANTRTHVTNLKLNGSVRAMTFTMDDDAILASGSDGDIYRFDLRYTKQCIERFSNQDGTITSAMAISKTHLAVGSESGVVNIYNETSSSNFSSSFTSSSSMHHHTMGQQRQPIKSILNLKTSINCMKFNHHDEHILSISSSRDPHNALRLIHIPTCSVFSNWPTSKTPLKYVFCTDFSYNNQYIAIGNDKGHCRLYRFKHYC
jgi:U3 small nucleolar RNA-associated protein 18